MDKYGSDKSPTRKAHSYTPIYHCLFQRRRSLPIQFLEIGLGYQQLMDPGRLGYVPGASVLGWRDYFPHGQVAGIDVRPDTLFESERIRTYLCDQGSRESLHDLMQTKLRESPDIVIDDGSHRPDHQLISLVTLFPYLAPGGIYVIEDVNEKTLFQQCPFNQQNAQQFHPLWNQVVSAEEYHRVGSAIRKGYDVVLGNPSYNNHVDDHLLILFKK